MIVIGAKGLAKQLLPSLLEMGTKDLYFFDELDLTNDKLSTFTIIHSEEEIKTIIAKDNRICIGVAMPKWRKELSSKYAHLGAQIASVIHSSSMISEIEVRLGEGLIILQQAIVESFVSIGDGTLLNIGSKICHDTIIGTNVEIGPNVTIAGRCSIGNSCSIGASATIIPDITIGENTIIGAGAVVVNNIPSNCLAVGVPAKIIKQLN